MNVLAVLAVAGPILLAATLVAGAARAAGDPDAPPLPPRRPAPALLSPGLPVPNRAAILPRPIEHPDHTRFTPPLAGEIRATGPVDPAHPLPGRFAPEATKLPSPFLKDKTVAPRTPDVELDLSDRTSVGAFGDLSQNPLKAENRIAPTPTRPLQGLDVGAGVTLQYRFPTQ